MELEIESTNVGAELISVKLNGVEKIHQGVKVLDNLGEIYWKRHFPVLFPIVGKLKNNSTLINKKEYIIPQNGFARDLEFELIEKTKISHRYVLKNSSVTKKQYPFKFELYVTYEVIGRKLISKYKVVNKERREISFGIGSKPAFICDVASGNYYIEFENDEKNIKILREQRGLILDKNSVINDNLIIDDKYIFLGENTFDFGVIILENITSKKIYLKCKEDNREILSMGFNDFPYLSIWSKRNAPFICLGPSFSVSDKKDIDSDFFNKENIVHLKPLEEFECSYYIYF